MLSKVRRCNPCLKLQFPVRKLSSSSNPESFSACAEKIKPDLSSDHVGKKTNVNLEPKSYFGIGKSVLSKCSYIWEEKADAFAENCSLQDLLGMSLSLFPETTRRFWRASALKPEDFLQILLGSGPEINLNLKKVDFLWKLFRWAGNQSENFQHLPMSYEIMLSMLIRDKMFEEAERLVFSAEAQGVLYESSKMFSEIIQGYAEASKLDNSVALYDQTRARGFVPSVSCYQVLLNLLIRKQNADLTLRVYVDMIEVGLGSCSEGHVIDFIVRELTKRGEILSTVNILKTVRVYGIKASSLALTAIVEGYCRKKDFEDMVHFMEEWEHIPDVRICNKIVSTLCRNLGSEEAWLFTQRMEGLGFVLDATTFGILISHSCRGRKLKSAFTYLAECISRNVEPNVYAYNSLTSGVFMEGLHSHAKDVFDDMIERGIKPDLSTFKILLAGYCKYRNFDEVKLVMDKMHDFGILSLGPGEDTLLKAFMFLGLDGLGVKVKRENYSGLSRAEFFDSLGNGLYLETDLDEYERILNGILEDEMIPDFDSLLVKEFKQSGLEIALGVKEEALQWGHTLSSSTYSELLNGLCASTTHMKEAVCPLEEMLAQCNQPDYANLNFLIQRLCKNGMTFTGRILLDEMFKKELLVKSETYGALIMGFCKERNIHRLTECLKLATQSMWVPVLKNFKVLMRPLCKWGMIKEVLQLFDCFLIKNPDLIFPVSNGLLKELCTMNFVSVGCLLLEELLHRGFIVDHVAYIYVIKGFLKDQKFAEALGLIEILLKKNINPCPSVYELFIPLLIRFNRFGEVVNMKQTLVNKHLEDVDFVHGTLLYHLCRLGKVKEAIFHVQGMSKNNVFLDGKTLNALLQGCCRENKLSKACEILSCMLRIHVDLTLSSYRSMVRQFCANYQFSKAFNLKKLIQRDQKLQLQVLYNILMFYIVQSGNSLLIDVLLNEMQANCVPPDQVTCNLLVKGFCGCANILRSVAVLNTMISEGLRPSNCSLRTVISYLCSNGKLDDALELSKMMERRKWKLGSVVQNTLVVGLLSYRRVQEAEHFLDRMEAATLIPNNITYDLLIKQFCLHQRIEKAMQLLNIMLKNGSHPSESSYSSVIHGLCASKSFDLALDFHAEMRHKNLEPSMKACNMLIYGLCSSGRTKDARKVLKEMLQHGPRPTHDVYTHVINRYYAENNLDKASTLFHEMQENGYSPNFETHWSLISNLSNCENNRNKDGKGFLSGLLSGRSPSLEESKEKNNVAF